MELDGTKTHQNEVHASAAGIPIVVDLFGGSEPRHEGTSDEALPTGMEYVNGRNGSRMMRAEVSLHQA